MGKWAFSNIGKGIDPGMNFSSSPMNRAMPFSAQAQPVPMRQPPMLVNPQQASPYNGMGFLNNPSQRVGLMPPSNNSFIARAPQIMPQPQAMGGAPFAINQPIVQPQQNVVHPLQNNNPNQGFTPAQTGLGNNNPNSIPGGEQIGWRPFTLGEIHTQLNELLQHGTVKNLLEKNSYFQKLYSNLPDDMKVGLLKSAATVGQPSNTQLDNPTGMANINRQMPGTRMQDANAQIPFQQPSNNTVMPNNVADQNRSPALVGGTPIPAPATNNNLSPKGNMTITPQSVYDLASKYKGLTEGKNSTVLNQFFTKNLGDLGNINPQDTAWCAAFANSVLASNGIKGTGALNAKSFLNFGTPTDNPTLGDIVVMQRGGTNPSDSWKGHVGFFAGFSEDGKSVKILGGNENDQVMIKNYPLSNLLGYRSITGASNTPYTNMASNVANNTTPQSNNVSNIISNVANKYGINNSYLKTAASIESDFNPNAQSKSSSAGGLYQFTDGTWNIFKPILNKLGLSTDKLNPTSNTIVMALYTKDNKVYLENKLNRPVNDVELYMAHNLGNVLAGKLLSAPSDTKISSFLSPSIIKGSGFLKPGQTAGQAIDSFKTYFNKHLNSSSIGNDQVNKNVSDATKQKLLQLSPSPLNFQGNGNLNITSPVPQQYPNATPSPLSTPPWYKGDNVTDPYFNKQMPSPTFKGYPVQSV